MSIELYLIQKMLDTEKDCIKLNKRMFEEIGIEPAVLYSYLVNNQISCEKPIYYNNERFCPYSVQDIQKATTLSAFKQRNALETLQKKGLIKIKMGQSKLRLISVVEDSNLIKNILFGTNFISKITKNEKVKYFLNQFKFFQETINEDLSEDILLEAYQTYKENLSSSNNYTGSKVLIRH